MSGTIRQLLTEAQANIALALAGLPPAASPTPPVPSAPTSGYALGPKSKAELQGVHPALVKIVNRAIEITSQDFTVADGIRTKAEQAEYVKRGTSQTMDSKHLPQADGLGHAVDLVPWINGKAVWNWPPIYHIAAAVHKAATELKTPLTWGGVWDRPFLDLDGSPAGLEAAVEAYAARRKALGKSALLDGPHHELR